MNILWIPHISWRVPQRAHAFCQALSKRHTIHVACFEHFGQPSAYLSWRFLASLVPRTSREKNITVHWVPRIAPTLSLASLRALNQRIFAKAVRRIIAANNIDTVIGSYLCPPPRAPRRILDLYDDNIAYARERNLPARAIAAIDANERAWMAAADHVVAASEVIAERRYPRAKVIPTGVALARYREARGGAIRNSLKIRGKLLGFISAQDRWPELRRVLLAARQFPSHTFLIGGTGPALGRGKAYVRAHDLENVRFTGAIPLADLPAYCKALDIGLCPYTRTPGRDAGFSMKFLSYTAAGNVVVSTALESIRRLGFPNAILTDDSDDAFLDGISRALRARYREPADLAQYDIKRLARAYEKLF